MKSYIFVLTPLLLAFAIKGSSQHKANHLFFGSNVVSFDSGEPVLLENSPMNGKEGCAAVSDSIGQLLFFTNGGGLSSSPESLGGIWNQEGGLMPNGAFVDSVGCFSAHQGTIIVPSLTNADQYYVVTKGCIEQNFDGLSTSLKYSLVDMSLDGGLGDVIEAGTELDNSNSWEEKVISVHVPCSEKTWIYYADFGTLKKIEYSAAGFSQPVLELEQIGAPWQLLSNSLGSYLWISEKLYSVDPVNGELSDPVQFEGMRGCFSSSGNVFYVINDSELFQYDLLASDILGSAVYLGEVLPGHMVIGGDDRIYVIQFNGSNLIQCRIGDPNQLGEQCDYQPEWQLDLGEGEAYGYPDVNPLFVYQGDPCITTNMTEIDTSGAPYLIKNQNSQEAISIDVMEKLELQILSSTGMLIDSFILMPGSFEMESKYSSRVLILKFQTKNGVWKERIVN